MVTTTDDTVVVKDNVGTATAGSALRYALLFLGGWLVSKGYISGDQLEQYVPIAISVLLAVYGVFKTHERKTKIVALGNGATPVTK